MVGKMTDLEQLQHAVKLATEHHDSDLAWLEQGETFDHSRLELERAERDSAASLGQATADLVAYLGCAVEASHGPLTIEWCPYRQQFKCHCTDCADGEYDGETGQLYATNAIGSGLTESEAFEAYYERLDL
jgi:hypothetical protein